MIGIQGLETNKAVLSEYTSKERKPLRDIDVNRSNHPNIPSKDRRNMGKAAISSGFQVFADGETSSFTKKANVQLPVKASTDDAKPVFGGKKPFQTINGACSKNSIIKDIGAKIVEQVTASDRTVSTTDAKATNINWLQKQLSLMQVKEISSQTQAQVLVTDSYDVETTKNAVTAVIPYFEEIDDSVRSGKQSEDALECASSKNLVHKEEPKSSISDTGATRKVVPDATYSTEVNIAKRLPTYKLNVMAKEWKAIPSNTKKKTLYDHGTTRDAAQYNNGVQQIPTCWDLYANDSQPNLPNQYTDDTGSYHHDMQPITQPKGRKIVGKRLTPFERGQQVAGDDILRELDDRTQEIQRYERYKEARRKKAIEAMRVNQERMKRNQLDQNVPTNMKNQLQPMVNTCTNYPTQCCGINSLQFTKNNSCNYVPTLPLSARAPGVKPSVWLIKYPTPPNLPIRYEPTDLLKMNYTPNKNTDKRAKKNQEKLKK